MTVADTTRGLRLLAELLGGMGPGFPDVYVTGRGFFFAVQVSSVGDATDATRLRAVDMLLAVMGGTTATYDLHVHEAGTRDATYGGDGTLGAYSISVYAPGIAVVQVQDATTGPVSL